VTFHHPVTGQVLETKEDFQAALAEIEERMAPLYRERRVIREAAEVVFDPPALPGRRYRTPVQEKVARCPRCRTRLESETAP
jgi:hypothetical protein